MPDTTATIKAKGCDATGLTEDFADRMGAHLGKRYMAIVELKVDAVTEDAEGKRKVAVSISMLEPTEDTRLDEHLRELTRTLYYNRKVDDAQPQLPDSGGPDPKIKDVIDAGAALIERDDDGEPVGLWDGTDDLTDEPAQLHDDGPAYDGHDPVTDVDDVDQPGDPIDDSNVVALAGNPLFSNGAMPG